jgi:hypothetical protein
MTILLEMIAFAGDRFWFAARRIAQVAESKTKRRVR